MDDAAWHFFTGEFPPVSGGVGDYSAILAGAMAAAGAEVHVWTGARDEAGAVPSNGASVHRIGDAWSDAGLTAIDAELNAQPAPRILLIQYVPNAWGQRGMNLGFCKWVERRARAGDDVRMMIHEPFLPYQFNLGPARWYMAWVQRRMLRTLLSAAGTIYLSISGWFEAIRPFQPNRDQVVTWLPVFSTIPVISDPERVRALRAGIANSEQLVVASFGTYGGAIGSATEIIFRQVLDEAPNATGLLLGRGGVRMAAQLAAGGGVPPTRLFAFEDMAADEVSCRLQGCDLMIQPYPDGISSRRSSAMAALAHGLPIVSNNGFLTDRIFREEIGVAATAKSDPSELALLAVKMLRSEDSRHGFGEAAKRMYDRHFAVEHTVAKLIKGKSGKSL